MPAQWGVDPITPEALLLLLRDQLRKGGALPWSNLPGLGLGERAFITGYPDDVVQRIPDARQQVAIRPGRFPLWQSVVQGAGGTLQGPGLIPNSTGFNAVVSLICYTQINADPEPRQDQALTEQTFSALAFPRLVMKAVQFWQPCTDATQQRCYLREPGRVTDGGFGVTPKRIGDGYWLICPFDLELKFTAAF